MSDEMLKLDELELLIREYDPEQSDWNFRRSVMMKIIDQIRPLTIRAAASAEPVGYDYGTEDSTACTTYGWHAAANGLFSTDPRVAKVWRQNMGLNVTPVYTHPAPDAEIMAALDMAWKALGDARASGGSLPTAKEPGYRTYPADGGQCLCDETEAVGCFNTPGSRA